MTESRYFTRPSALTENAIFASAEAQGSPTRAKLNAKAIAAALAEWPRGKRWRVHFDQPKGLFLNVTPSGYASYYLQFVGADGRRSETVIGAEKLITPAIAKAMAEERIAKAMLSGVSPIAAKRERIAAARAAKLNTFKALTDAFMVAPENLQVRPRTIEQREELLRQILPLIGGRPAGELKRADIRDCIRTIQQNIKAKRLDVPNAGFRRANIALGVIQQVFAWAEAQELSAAVETSSA